MEESRIQDLIEEERYDDAEAWWLERLETGSFDINELFQAAKLLRRNKEKARAGVLVGLLAEHFLEHQNWPARLMVLKEMARFEPLEQMKVAIREALLKVYPNNPSLNRLLRSLSYDAISSSDELVQKLKQIQRWMDCDTGQIVFHPRYGAGKVAEVNYNLNLVRVDFESRKDVALEINDTELSLLPPRHILREKLESPEQLKQQALGDPGATVGRLLETIQHPMKVSEIREVFHGIIPDEQWTSWWNAVRKHPQILASGKGAQATYSWSASAEDAESVLRSEFARSDLPTRIEIVKRISNRNSDLMKYFQQEIISDARRAFQEKQTASALQAFDFVSRISPSALESLGFSFDDVLLQADPLTVLSNIHGPRLDILKEKVILSFPNLYPEGWKEIYKNAFFQEENPRILTLLFDRLNEANEIDNALGRLYSNPHRFPGLFVWICENCAQEDARPFSVLTTKLDGRFLIHALTALDEPVFSPYRSRLKNALEKGLLLQILKRSIQKTDAEKSIRLLEHLSNLEDYRRDRLKGLILSWVPELKQKEDRIFTTQEALTRKKKELEHLMQVELPTNRKAVGEAAAHGDLRENAEYKAARERQDYLIARVEALQHEIGKARVLEPGQIECSEVRPGTRITLNQPDGKQMLVTILGLWDSNPKEGIYSYQSGIALNLLGKILGDSTEINGEKWTIEKIEAWM